MILDNPHQRGGPSKLVLKESTVLRQFSQKSALFLHRWNRLLSAQEARSVGLNHPLRAMKYMLATSGHLLRWLPPRQAFVAEIHLQFQRIAACFFLQWKGFDQVHFGTLVPLSHRV